MDQKITQAHVSPGLIKSFETKFLERYHLNRYHDPKRPAFFFGIYHELDLELIKNHQALAVIIWGGSDILQAIKLKNHYCQFLDRSNIRHLAISSDISQDIINFGCRPYPAVFTLVNHELYQAQPLGPNIYIYANHLTKERYGEKYYQEVQSRFPKINFIIASHNTYTQLELIKVYQSCFLGLRLTKHDGNANTVQELGLCGIKCVHNSDLPNAIRWQTIDDICQIIISEQEKIGTIQSETSTSMLNYLNSDPTWLNIKYYQT